MSAVVIVDNGGANVASLRFALQRLGCEPRLSVDAVSIRQASHVLLPGVGAAADAMRRLRAAGLAEVIAQLQQPVLGICLGMQLLYETSEEGDTPCLGAIPGRVTRLRCGELPVPHMGWNQLQYDADSPLLSGIAPGEYAYFVHSYAVPVGRETIARAEYGGAFSAVISHRNFHATQFHPERSAATGARLLRNFLGLH